MVPIVFHDVAHVAELLSVAKSTVYRLHACGVLPSHGLGIRCTDEDVLECVQRMATEEGKRKIKSYGRKIKINRRGRPAGSAEARKVLATQAK